MMFSPKDLLGYKEFYFYSSKHSQIPRLPGQYFLYFLSTGHFYIGSTSNLCKRIARHKADLINNRHHNKKLQKVYNNTDAPIYFYYKQFSTKEESLKIEQEKLNTYYHTGLCCNITIIARNESKPKFTNERKKQISVTSKLVWQRPGQREKVSIAIKESHSNPEVIAKISQASKERWNNPKYRSLMIDVANRNFQSEKHRQQASVISTKLWNDPEHRQNRLDAMRAAQAVPELKAKRSDNAKQFWADPEHRSKRIESLRKIGSSPEFKAKMKAINSARFQDPVYREKIKQAKQRNCKKITIDGITYDSFTKAAQSLNLNQDTLRYKLKTGKLHRTDVEPMFNIQ